MSPRPAWSSMSDGEWSAFLDSVRRRLKQETAFSSKRYEDEPIIQRGSDFLRSQEKKRAEEAKQEHPAPQQAGTAGTAADDAARRRRGKLIEASIHADLTDKETFERFFPEAARFVNAGKGAEDEEIPSRTSAGRTEPRKRTIHFDPLPTSLDPLAANTSSSDDIEEDYGEESLSDYGPSSGYGISSSYGGRSYGRSYGYGESSSYDYWGTSVPPERTKAPLTEELKELRQIEHGTDRRLSSGAIFAQQIATAWEYEEEQSFPNHAWRQIYHPTYALLNNTELRDYFHWRTLWRQGKRSEAPGFAGLLYAYELVAKKDALDLDFILDELETLLAATRKQDAAGIDSITTSGIAAVQRDFLIFSGWKPELYFSQEDLGFYRSVLVLRQAQSHLYAEAGWEDEYLIDSAEPVDDDKLLEALVGISTFDLSRSPFCRAHRQEFASVTSKVFALYVKHCHQRRKTSFVDGLVGTPLLTYTTPFYSTPLVVTYGKQTAKYEVMPGCGLYLIKGYWHAQEPASEVSKNRTLAKIFREIDREMRDAWGFGHPLKQQKLPKYALRYIEQAVAEKKAEDEAAAKAAEEADRRRFKVDLTKLKGIRSAAAQTREALLVDEEREGYVAQPTLVDVPAPAQEPEEEPPAIAPLPAQAPTAPAAAGDGDAPFGLTPEELALARALLEGKDIAPIVSAGSATVDMLIDSMNEKLFDLVGDVCFEFGEEGPEPIEDYEEDLRKALLP